MVDRERRSDGVGDLIHEIVVQEMFHFALAGNMLAAIGGAPRIANAGFLPTYPTNTLPGGIHQELPVRCEAALQGSAAGIHANRDARIPPVELALRAAAPATIGAFYDTISNAFDALNPVIDQNAHFVAQGAEVFQIKSIDDAHKAINRIKSEGEGAPGSPDQPANPGELAHFYVFKEILVGNVLKLDPATGKLVKGSPIRFPAVLPFAPSSAVPSPSIAFNQALSQLLTDIEACWTEGAALRIALGDMRTLQQKGLDLISRGIRPEFAWVAPA